MKNDQNRILAYMALYAALCVVLQYAAQLIPFLQMPNGGSIELGYAALFTASYHLGWKKGIAVGLLWWLLGFLFGFNAYYVSPMQYFLDYLAPVVVCGAAALVPAKNEKGILAGVGAGMVVVSSCREMLG